MIAPCSARVQRPGRWYLQAGLLVLDANPLDDVEHVTRVAAVFKDGMRVA